ncbi:hypothetical protein [Naasia sp. SYSU D00948]|uniref:hypothetical protein n=1 Tax=Naasia sp. SYSU D00948 TaxID=2817379 RepID=UPI001B30DB5A|nr:hypothetical protein [Naasia sp. SYSU D00948]
MSAADLQQVADELYSLPLPQFTAERNARAKEMRSGGDRALAAEIARLPKPSVAAWAANTLVRERGDQVGDVLSLGAMLREAQQDLDPDALRTLTQQRRQLVAALGREAARIAAGKGQQLSSAVVEELEHTLQAAMTDPDAADALRTGRLLRSLSGTGLEAVDLTDAVALPGGTPAPAPRRKATAPPRDDLAAARERRKVQEQDDAEERARAAREEAERELERVRGEADEADAAAGRADRVLRDVERRREEARGRREELRAELRRLKAALAEAEQGLGTVEDELEDLETERDEAARAADRARLAADRMQEELRRGEDRLRSAERSPQTS